MRIILDIKDSEASFFIKILKSFPFVKNATLISDSKANFLQNTKQSIEELTLIKEGKLKGIPADNLLDEL